MSKKISGGETMLKINQVTKTYGTFTAVSGVSLEANKGEIVGIVGANGAGKTTTFRMTLGLIQPTSGTITWDGESIDHQKSHVIGYLPEERGLYPKVTVYDQLLYFARLRGMEKKEAAKRIDEWLEKFQISQYKKKKAGELSKGNQQKVQFIYAVLHEPALLILDEPFSGLDPINIELLKKAILEVKAKGTTILFSTHRMEHVEELCERIAIFKQGTIIEQGLVKEIRRKYGKKQVHLGTDYELTFEHLGGIEHITKTTTGYTLSIEDERYSQDIIAHAMQQGFIRQFEIEEPSLNEVFIHVVGGDGHE